MEKSDRMLMLKEMLGANPGDPFLQHAMALEYIRLNRDEDAAECFSNLLQADPDYLGSYYHYAQVLLRLGRREESFRFFEKGMELAKKTGDMKTFSELHSAMEEAD